MISKRQEVKMQFIIKAYDGENQLEKRMEVSRSE